MTLSWKNQLFQKFRCVHQKLSQRKSPSNEKNIIMLTIKTKHSYFYGWINQVCLLPQQILPGHVHLPSHYFRFLSRHQQINYVTYLLSCPSNNYSTYNICYSNKVTCKLNVHIIMPTIILDLSVQHFQGFGVLLFMMPRLLVNFLDCAKVLIH